jgi:lipoprotein-releasing system ATP-binding protein
MKAFDGKGGLKLPVPGGTIAPTGVLRGSGIRQGEPFVYCRNLRRSLGEGSARLEILKGIDLDLYPGRLHAVVGPSGCGKSTLLYILGLLDTPDEGEFRIRGRSVLTLSDSEASQYRSELIGFVFQFHFLLAEFTALENVMIPMARLGRLPVGQMRQRALELLDAVGLGSKAEKLARQLSGGEQQRVAVARALANDPPLILADEPTGNLDTANSEQVFSLLARLVRSGQKVLLVVTHNPAIAQACDEIYEMRDGRIIARHAGCGPGTKGR